MNTASDVDTFVKGAAIMEAFSSCSTIKSILARDQILVYKCSGHSMLPMLRPDRDMIVFVPVKDRLKKYDVALYTSGQMYIAHRIVQVMEGGYLIRGDNTYVMEAVAEEDVIGVLTHFVRNGRKYPVSHKGYRIYSCLWCMLFPVRLVSRKCIHWGEWVLRKMGITPLVKKLLKI